MIPNLFQILTFVIAPLTIMSVIAKIGNSKIQIALLTGGVVPYVNSILLSGSTCIMAVSPTRCCVIFRPNRLTYAPIRGCLVVSDEIKQGSPILCYRTNSRTCVNSLSHVAPRSTEPGPDTVGTLHVLPPTRFRASKTTTSRPAS